MPSWKTPTNEEVERAITLLARPEQRRYFFDKLQNPRWIKPLEAHSFFNNPPSPITDDKKQTIQFPPWPALQYLARMAAIPDAQDDVLRIALNIPESGNISVYDTIAEIATKLPATLAATLATKAPDWLTPTYRSLLPVHLGNLIEHLAKNGEPKAAATLVRTTLTPTKKELGAVGSLIDPWHYGEILQQTIPSLTKNLGMEFLDLTADLLQTAAPPYTRQGQPTAEDGSTIWHDRIEQDEEPRHDIRNLLVTATRNTAALLAQQSPDQARAVIKSLEARPTIVFHRIALEILRRENNNLPDIVREHLTNRDLFTNNSLRHEYQRLLHDAFTNLDATSQEHILTWIQDGPSIQEYEERLAASGQTVTDDQRELYRKHWQRRQLTPIAHVLPPNLASRYEQIIGEIGPQPDEPTRGFVGPTSPLTKKELERKTPEEIIDYLRSWTPTNEFLGPSRAALAIHLQSIIAETPTLFDNQHDHVRQLHPTYVRNYFYGLREAYEKKRPINWERVLPLAEWIVQRPRDQQPRGDSSLDDEHGWAGTRSAIADLLTEAINNTMPVTFREIAWRIIAPLTNDPDPTVEYEATCGPTMDAALLAINTTRGKAMEAVIKYALMLRQQDPEITTFESMLEVRDVIDEHLNHDDSLAIRSVYGRFFPWIVLLDKNWATTNLDKIFGDERGNAAWEAYLTFCPAYDETVNLLAMYYEHAVNKLDPSKQREPRGGKPDPDEHLGEHLMAQYYRGHIPLNDGLLPRFFTQAPKHARNHAIEFLGRVLYTNKTPAPAPVRERLTRLWESRRDNAKTSPGGHEGELTAFGWWFSAGKLDTTWELNELRDVLLITHTIELDHSVIERLSTLANEHPAIAVECLRALAAGERQYWTIISAEEKVRSILATALQHDESRTAATALVHELGIIGYNQYRNLLQKE